MIWNIIDRRAREYRWKKINAIIEATAHDNSCQDTDTAEPADNDVTYAQREGISLKEAIDWAHAGPSAVTLYLYDEGEGTTQPIPHNSITRLRLRSIFTLPAFARETRAIAAQCAETPGFLSGAVLAEGRLVFWTRSAWESAEAMKAFRDSGAHRVSMPKLMEWCDEASVAHWEGPAAADWDEIYARMAAEGRASRVRRPTKAHAAKRFARMWRWGPEQKIG